MMLLEARNIDLALPDRAAKPLFGPAPLKAILHAVDLDVDEGEWVGVVGESGSGKSTLARTLLRLHRPDTGTIRFAGNDITALPEHALRPIRAQMQMIFQDSQSALNPRLRVGAAIAEPMRAFGRHGSHAQRLARAQALLAQVGLPAEFAGRYPHQLSGGQRQRIGIARALALEPRLVVADEIVSGLDVSVQAQILALLASLRQAMQMALVFISHDLSVVRAICDRIAVMQEGRIVETGPTSQVFEDPQHPYTKRLLQAIPLPVVDDSWIGDDTAR